MATQIAYANGNLTGATTWKTAEVGSGALTMVRANTTTLASNTTITSPAFTITNADVIEGVLLWVMATAAAPAGTLTVNILKSAVSQASVTVNMADLPHSATGTNDVLAVVPVFFRFTSTATGDGTANWTINMVTSNNASATLTYSRNSATAGDFTKALRTSTTATIAAADDLYVVGELTGAGTNTARTVTMDSTATTAYGNGTVNSTAANGGGVRISNYGTLTYGTSASTNYNLRVNGDVEVYWNGTLTIGITGTEIPRTSTAVLELQMASATGDFGLQAHNLSTVNIAGLSRTAAKNVVQCKLNANVAATNTTLNVDTDTGWLSGDVVCVASTTRTIGDCESLTLTGNATSTSMATGAAASAHSGTSPTQGEVGLLTRNVKIRSTSSSLLSYVYFEPLATVTASWAEFYYLGSGTIKKQGVYLDSAASGTANAKSITYCSVHDVYISFYLNGNNNSINATVSNNVVWNTSNLGMEVSNTLTLGDWTVSSNLLMKTTTYGYYLGDLSGTFSNNTIVGCSTYGIYVTLNNSMTIGTFSGNTAHSNSSAGLYFTATYINGNVGTQTCWRNGSYGLDLGNLTGPCADLTFSSPTLFGNTTANFYAASGDGVNISGGTLAGDATFSTSYGVALVPANNGVLVNISSVDMSGSGTGLVAHANYEFYFGTNPSCAIGTVNNCKFGTTVISSKSAWAKAAYLGFEKYSQTAGDHRCEMTYGQLKTDSTIYNNASPSMRMTPNNASNKLQSAPLNQGIKVSVANGTTVNIAVYIRKSAAGDGAAYTGNQPRLIQRANPALGQTADVVLATYSAGTGAWNQLSATSSSATDAGAWEFIVDCDGTAGWINVDDWTTS